MKVLFLTNIPSPYRVDFFNELGKSCDLTVTFEGKNATDRDDKWKAANEYNFNAVYLKGFRVSSDKFFCIGILKILSKEWDIIIIGGYSTPTSILAIEYLNFKKKNFFIEADGGFITKDNCLKYKIKKHLISSASWWFTSGNETTKYLVHYGAKKEKCFWYPFTSIKEEDLENAAKLKQIDKSKLKRKLCIKEDIVLLAVGRFIKLKAYDVLMKSTKELPKNIGIYIVGGEPPKEYIKLKTLYQLNNLHFVEFKTKNELAYYYAIADIFIHPTRSDVWGLVINEAMTFGLPIITTEKCIAGLELVDNKNGAIIPVNDFISLRYAINNILNSNIAEMGNISFKRIKQYTIENMAKAHIDILSKVKND